MKKHACSLGFLLPVLLGILGCGGSSGQDAAPPLAIGSWQQARLLQGPQAVSMVNAMHPTSAAPAICWVGYYGGITVYGSRFQSPEQARSAYDAMKNGLGQEKSGFTPAQPLTVAGQAGFHTTGVNKEHFFYVRGSWLIWVEGKAEDFAPTVRSMRWGKAARS